MLMLFLFPNFVFPHECVLLTPSLRNPFRHCSDKDMYLYLYLLKLQVISEECFSAIPSF